MRRRLLLIGMLLALTACGCWPRRIIWSPDGERAVLIGGERLYLCDGEGTLSGGPQCEAGAIAWFADSQRLLIHMREGINGWHELAPLLTDEQTDQAVALAEKLREEILATEGPWDDFKAQTLEGLSPAMAAAVLVCMRDRFGDGLAEKVGEKWQDLEDFTTTISMIRQASIQDGRLGLGAVLVRSLESLLEMRLSPNQAVVAFTTERREGTAALLVAPAEAPARARRVAEAVSRSFDWTPDGQSLVFAVAPLEKVEDDLICAGELTARTVCDEAGGLLETFSGTTELAKLVYDSLRFKVRCLKDGRILFATLPVELPYTGGEMPERVDLFAIEPGKQPRVFAVLPPAAEVPELVDCFQLSPDEKHVAIPGEKGQVAVVELAGGHLRTIETMECSRLWTLPAWRSADELCFAVPPGSEHGSEGRKEIVLWPLKGQVRCLSQAWDEEVVNDILRE